MKIAFLITLALLAPSAWTEGIDDTVVITSGGNDLDFMNESKQPSLPF